MDPTITYAMMISIALLMAILPFGIFMGLGSLIGIPIDDSRIIITFILAALAISYVTAMGSFALIQKSNCGSVKSMSQVAQNAGIATGIQAFTLIVCYLLPGVRNIVSGLFPPDLDPAISTSVGYSYYSFWAALFGIAIGGSLSGICKE